MASLYADYLLETPYDPEHAAAVMAGEQGCGTFMRVHGETDELRARAGVRVLSVEEVEGTTSPALPNARLKGEHRFRRAKVRLGFPVDNIRANLPTLAATVAGNLFDLGELTGLRLLDIGLDAEYRDRFARPTQGIEGTRRSLDVHDRPIFGTIVKPNVGLSADQIADLFDTFCESGLDIVKDDEIACDPRSAPIHDRILTVSRRQRDFRDRTGRNVMYAFNITDETDAMRRHLDLIEKEGGNCVMVSLNWIGLAGLETLRRSTGLAIHGHRNGFGAISRCPDLGLSAPAYQTLYRLAGVDHLHVHGLRSKFSDDDAEVTRAAMHCLTPLAGDAQDRVFPVLSSGQWAGTVAPTHMALGSPDFMFMAGGGIMAHPDGPAIGVRSLKEAWEACAQGIEIETYARKHPALAAALANFERR